ncbi:bifunctional serine/threonine-protein kinase/ABC transporter substrate-binding protein [Nocardia brasiliensis]|uniref:bifunctional serine/threonine-protein kinase/ABC transporter substrate-binding protein n=1 Tax=Nocardia brasiliensis TaxID=37326 RepID=UPI0036732654
MPRAGEVFAGYVIKCELGRGGMGAVYLAKHPRLPRLTALKLLNPELYTDNEIRARFEREADLAARLDHPNIVTVYDRGVDAGRLWISMQYVDGVDAGTLDWRTLAPNRAIAIIEEIAKALDYAHAVGVLHRDVKPANILLARAISGQDERVLLTDFGIARLRDDTKHLTQTGTITATVAYGSPEQLSGLALDHGSDQYSLACSLFQLLTGAAPFDADNSAAVIAGHLHRPVPPLSCRRPGLPTELDAVLAKGLAKDSDDRFGSCSEFAAAARAALTPSASPADLAAPSAAEPAATPTLAERRATACPAATLRTRRFAALGALMLVSVLTIAAGITWARSNLQEPAHTAATTATAATTRTAPTTDFSGPPPAPGQILPVTQVDLEGHSVVPAADPANPAGDGKATCQPLTIAFAGPMSGPTAKFGTSAERGAKLAVDQFTRANPGCRITLKDFDTTGDPQVATQIARQITDDPSIIALIGPMVSSEVVLAGKTFDNAGLPFLTPSATKQLLSAQGWRSFFRGLPNDKVQGQGLARYLVESAHFRKICVVQDDSDYSSGVARAVVEALGPIAEPSCAATVKTGKRDFSTGVARVAAVRPDAVFYVGYYQEAAPLVQQLRQAGITAAFASGDGSFDPEFVAQGGDAARGAFLSCPCGPSTNQFVTDYQGSNGQSPYLYSVEAYDLTTIVLKGIAAGRVTRADLLTYLRAYDGVGVARSYKWTGNGELGYQRIWIYKVT